MEHVPARHTIPALALERIDGSINWRLVSQIRKMHNQGSMVELSCPLGIGHARDIARRIGITDLITWR